MVNVIVAGAAIDCNDVKTHIAVDAVSHDETPCSETERTYLLSVNSHLGRNEGAFLSRLHLNKHHEVAALLGNDVDVAVSCPPILEHNGVSLFA